MLLLMVESLKKLVEECHPDLRKEMEDIAVNIRQDAHARGQETIRMADMVAIEVNKDEKAGRY